VVTRSNDRPDVGAGSDPVPFVRPYTITGAAAGRVRSWHPDLELETLVVTSVLGEIAGLGFERRSIVRLCRDARSVAEIAARLRLPLGVAKALVGDLADEGLVELHGSPGTGDHSDPALLRRVLDGLQRI
jgi:Protein of unknown function (DUF742)